MSRPPPPPPPLPIQRVSANQGLKISSSITLKEELESRITKTEEIFLDCATSLYSSDMPQKPQGLVCQICHKTIENSLSHTNSHATQVFPWLYLGSMNNSQDLSELNYCEVDTIINLTSECGNNFQSYFKYFTFPLADSCDNLERLREVSFLLENLRLDGHKVFVHCVQGVSRGPSLILSYLMRFAMMSLREAYYFLHSKRSTVRPRLALLTQLISMEIEIFNCPSMEVTELWQSEDD